MSNVLKELAPIDLGTVEEVTDLFSYPPNYNATFLLSKPGKRLTRTLEDTVALYVNTSLKRDGFTDAAATARVVGDRVLVTIAGINTGDAASAAYASALPQFMGTGKIGLAASRKNAITTQSTRNALWRYNWRFFLPLGLAMVNHKTVQLLHFPPDTVLSVDQDYLAASTTKRWASLLVANGALPQETDGYQTIVDAAPIAAPSSDGNNVTIDVCLSFTKYTLSLLEGWLPAAGGKSRPMVAFGVPVRQWLQHQFATGELGVLSLASFNLPSGLAVTTLTANHPSLIFNLDKNLVDDPNTPVDERLCPLIPTMQQDLIAAGWQVGMAANPDADPKAMLDNCTAKWTNPAQTAQICQFIYQQAFNMTPDAAAQLVRAHPLPDCAERIVADPTGDEASVHQENANKVLQKLGGSESTLPEQQ